MSTNPQLQSALIARLPREVLDHIYLELWRAYGLRQHIFWNDMNAIQMFLGYCTLHPFIKSWSKPVITVTPPAFYQHARHLEISLSPDFPMLLWCANFDAPELGRRHEAWDFHWLRLDRFQKLQSIQIWMAARSITSRLDSNNNFLAVKQLNTSALKNVLAPFDHLDSFTLSTPLGSTVGPEDEGYVDDVSASGIRVYKRGAGDNFHPFLNIINPDDGFDGLIHTSPTRYACTRPLKLFERYWLKQIALIGKYGLRRMVATLIL
ncbi:MAG: hypothetical protein Q9227_005162 [Pyrenula ochraceoflavens]